MAEAKRKPDPESTWGANPVIKQQWVDTHAGPVRKATEQANKIKEAGGPA
jgi:hypothetical protein